MKKITDKYGWAPRWIALLTVATSLAFCGERANAQSMPTDLMDMSLEELLKVHLISRARIGADETVRAVSRWGFGYRFTRTEFGDYLDGSHALTIAEVLEQFPVVPNRIEQEAHTVELTYAHSADTSLIALIPYIRQTTDHVRRKGDPFMIDSEGVGDILVQGARRAFTRGSQHLSLNAGISLPTGSIDERGDTPRGANSPLPYTMQIGSGTFDLIPGITYTAGSGDLYWGGQVKGVMRLGRNGRGYSLGDRILTTAWVRRQTTPWLALSLKGAYQSWGEIDGADPDLDPTLAPVANPDIQCGRRATVLIGAAIQPWDGRFKGNSLEFEWGAPFYQDLHGPQPGQDWQFSFGWRKGI